MSYRCAILFSFLLLSAPAVAITGKEDIDKLRAQVNQCAALINAGERSDALSAIRRLKKLAGSPKYKDGIHYNHNPATADTDILKEQATAVATLFSGMVSGQRSLAPGGGYSDEQQKQARQIYAGDQTTVLKLLNKMEKKALALGK
jgi:hypothetical protein